MTIRRLWPAIGLLACADANAAPEPPLRIPQRVPAPARRGIGDVIASLENRLSRLPCDSAHVTLETGSVRSRDTVVAATMRVFWEGEGGLQCLPQTVLVVDSLSPSSVTLVTAEDDGVTRGVMTAIVALRR